MSWGYPGACAPPVEGTSSSIRAELRVFHQHLRPPSPVHLRLSTSPADTNFALEKTNKGRAGQLGSGLRNSGKIMPIL